MGEYWKAPILDENHSKHTQTKVYRYNLHESRRESSIGSGKQRNAKTDLYPVPAARIGVWFFFFHPCYQNKL